MENTILEEKETNTKEDSNKHLISFPSSFLEFNQLEPQGEFDGNKKEKSGKEELFQLDDPNVYIEISPYLHLTQQQAAQKLDMKTSTLGKKWKEVTCGRKWPYRSIKKIEVEIARLLKNYPGKDGQGVSAEMEPILYLLLKKRKEELKPVWIKKLQ